MAETALDLAKQRDNETFLFSAFSRGYHGQIPDGDADEAARCLEKMRHHGPRKSELDRRLAAIDANSPEIIKGLEVKCDALRGEVAAQRKALLDINFRAQVVFDGATVALTDKVLGDEGFGEPEPDVIASAVAWCNATEETRAARTRDLRLAVDRMKEAREGFRSKEGK